MLGFNGFPAGAAVSVNEAIVHGLPSERAFSAADLANIQFAVVSDAAFASQGWTFPVGALDAGDRVLLEAGPRALRAAVNAVSPGARVGDIGAAIQAEVEGAGLSVVRAFVGYRMGGSLINPPQICGTGRPGTGARLRKEWILNLHVILKRGTHAIFVDENRWTAVAEDGQRGALFTAMVEVTADGHRLPEHAPRRLSLGRAPFRPCSPPP